MSLKPWSDDPQQTSNRWRFAAGHLAVVSMTGTAPPVCGGYAQVIDTRDERNHLANPVHPLVMHQSPTFVNNI